LIQGWLLEAALGERIGVTDEEWEVIGPLLPPERGRGCRPAQDNRPYFEGMMWIARTGAQWRHLPDEYGKWNSVFRFPALSTMGYDRRVRCHAGDAGGTGGARHSRRHDR